MFTGIIEELGEVDSIHSSHQGATLCVKCPTLSKASDIGDSIAVNGACLTVTSIIGKSVNFGVSLETLKKTTLGTLKTGEKVNLESALKVGSKLGGHFVSGHVEDTGIIKSKTTVGNAITILVEAPQSILDYTINKGSIAVDGISLTVVNTTDNTFSVVIIPHTLNMTTLGFKKAGDKVNLEPDMLAKYAAHFLSKFTDRKRSDMGLLEALHKSGYV